MSQLLLPYWLSSTWIIILASSVFHFIALPYVNKKVVFTSIVFSAVLVSMATITVILAFYNFKESIGQL